MNDSMHAYFANGVAALEINLLMQEVQRCTSKTIDDIKQAVLQAGWMRSGQLARDGQTKHWTARLFVPAFFVGSMYKGTAKQTMALLPLLLWLAESVWSKVASLRLAVDSFGEPQLAGAEKAARSAPACVRALLAGRSTAETSPPLALATAICNE